MNLNTLQSKTKRMISDRIGRGGKRGKTSGRGVKGQRAHGDHGVRPELRDAIKKLPKRRGYGKNRGRTHVHTVNYIIAVMKKVKATTRVKRTQTASQQQSHGQLRGCRGACAASHKGGFVPLVRVPNSRRQ